MNKSGFYMLDYFLYNLFSVNESYQDYNDSYHKKNVYKAANGKRGYYTEKPKNYEYYCNCC